MPFNRKPSDSSAHTYINGIGFLPDSPKQQEKKALNFQLSALVLSFLLFLFLRTALPLPILHLLKLFGGTITINRMTGLVSLSDTAFELCSILVYLISMVLLCIAVWLLGRRTIQTKVLFSLPPLREGFLSYWMILGVALVAEGCSRLFVHLFQGVGLVLRAQSYDPPKEFLPFVLYLFLISLLPAVLEELLFHGLLLHTLRRFDEMFAILVSSAFFTLMQPTLERMLFSFILSMAMGFFALRKGGLLLCVLANFSVRAFDFLLYLSQRQTPQDDFLLWSILAILLLSIALLAFYRYVKTNPNAFRLSPDASVLTNREKVRYLFSNLGFWALIVFAFFKAINHIEIIN